MASGPVAAERGVRRLGILAQWSPEGGLPEYVRIHLDRLRPHCSRLILVSNSPLNGEARAAAARICDHVVERPNQGYDFAAWRDALLSEDLNLWDEVLLTNSSVIGPLFPLDDVFETMSQRDCDFWGMTYSKMITTHIQTYFLVFRAKMLRSSLWMNYWKGVTDKKSKRQVILNYETRLTNHFKATGFRSDTYITDNTSGARRFFLRRPMDRLPILVPRAMRKVDPTITLAYETILKGMPYLKASVVWTPHSWRRCPIEKIKSLPQVDYPWDAIGV